VAQRIVRDLEESVKVRLQRRARRHGHSMEEEVRTVLRNAVRNEEGPAVPLGTRLKNRFSGIGLEGDIPELRGRKARPAVFKKG
jgi:plasmid stability protein